MRGARALFAASVAALTGCATTPASPDFSIVKSRAGAVVVWNEAPSHFTVEIPGTRLVPEPKLPGASLIVDGVPVQTFTVRISRLTKEAACGADLLRCHRDWEVAHRRSLLDSSLGVRELPSPAPGFMAWAIDMPAEVAGKPSGATEQVFATRIVGEVVLVLGVTQFESRPAGSAARTLAAAAASFRQFDEEIDVEAISRELATQ